jgi:hypothetical protein
VIGHESELLGVCMGALDGVGDPKLGEWVEVGETAMHLRRRLNPIEQASVGPVVDVRGTPEGQRRMDRARRFLPRGFPVEDAG